MGGREVGGGDWSEELKGNGGLALTLPVVALTNLAWQSTEPVRIKLPSWLVATQVSGPW